MRTASSRSSTTQTIETETHHDYNNINLAHTTSRTTTTATANMGNVPSTYNSPASAKRKIDQVDGPADERSARRARTSSTARDAPATIPTQLQSPAYFSFWSAVPGCLVATRVGPPSLVAAASTPTVSRLSRSGSNADVSTPPTTPISTPRAHASRRIGHANSSTDVSTMASNSLPGPSMPSQAPRRPLARQLRRTETAMALDFDAPPTSSQPLTHHLTRSDTPPLDDDGPMNMDSEADEATTPSSSSQAPPAQSNGTHPSSSSLPRRSTIPPRSKNAIKYHPPSYTNPTFAIAGSSNHPSSSTNPSADPETDDKTKRGNTGRPLQRSDTEPDYPFIEQAEHTKQIAEMGIKSRDFAYEPKPEVGPLEPLTPRTLRMIEEACLESVSTWCPNYALAEYDLRTGYGTTKPSTKRRPAIDGKTLSRLLKIGWVTLREVQAQCSEEDWEELRKWRRRCLKKAKARPDGDEQSFGETEDDVDDGVLGLTLKSGKNRRSEVSWEDGELPWKVQWKGSGAMPDSPCLQYVFNESEDQDQEDAAYELLMALKPQPQERIALIPIARTMFHYSDKVWDNMNGNS